MKIEKGDIVKLPEYLKLSKFYPKDLRGIVVNTNGGYYEVAPLGCWWITEFYENELLFDSKWPGTKTELTQFSKKFTTFYKYMINSKGNQ